VQIILGPLATPNTSLVDVQKTYYHNEQLEQLLDSMWLDLAW
jgi:hypothetical protein